MCVCCENLWADNTSRSQWHLPPCLLHLAVKPVSLKHPSMLFVAKKSKLWDGLAFVSGSLWVNLWARAASVRWWWPRPSASTRRSPTSRSLWLWKCSKVSDCCGCAPRINAQPLTVTAMVSTCIPSPCAHHTLSGLTGLMSPVCAPRMLHHSASFSFCLRWRHR